MVVRTKNVEKKCKGNGNNVVIFVTRRKQSNKYKINLISIKNVIKSGKTKQMHVPSSLKNLSNLKRDAYFYVLITLKLQKTRSNSTKGTIGTSSQVRVKTQL